MTEEKSKISMNDERVLILERTLGKPSKIMIFKTIEDKNKFLENRTNE